MNKRLLCAMLALLMVGVNIINVGAVFADELAGGEDSETAETVGEVGPGEGPGAAENKAEGQEEVKPGEEETLASEGANGGEESKNELSEPEVKEPEAKTLGADTPALAVENALPQNSDINMLSTPMLLAEADDYDFEMTLGQGTTNISFDGINLNNFTITYRCRITTIDGEETDGLSCNTILGRPNGVVTATKAGGYTVKLERFDLIPYRGWVEVGSVNVAVYDLVTDADEGWLFAAGDPYSYSIDPELTFGEITTTISRNGEVIATAEGTDSIDFDRSVAGTYQIEISNDSSFAIEQGLSVTYEILVWDVVPTYSVEISEADWNSIAAFAREQIKGFIETGEISEQMEMFGDVESLVGLLIDDPVIVLWMDSFELPEDEYEMSEAYEEVQQEIRENEVVAGVSDVYLVLSVGGQEVGLIYELDTPVTMNLVIPESAREVPSGYSRTFYVVRGHIAVDGTATAQRIETTRNGDLLNFENDMFSSFTIVYEDEEIPTSPESGAFTVTTESGSVSSDTLATVAMVMAILSLVGIAKFVKR